jgi:hypothetical protein
MKTDTAVIKLQIKDTLFTLLSATQLNNEPGVMAFPGSGRVCLSQQIAWSLVEDGKLSLALK